VESTTSATVTGAVESTAIATVTGVVASPRATVVTPYGARVDSRCHECREMTLLIAASMGGQKELVAHLLKRCHPPASLEMADTDGYTALMWAAEQGELGVLTLLLKAGACTDPRPPAGALLPPDAAPSPTDTALTIACERGHASIVFALLRAGASTIAPQGDGTSALECVARQGHVAAAKALIGKQRLSLDDPHALNALILAAMRGHIAVMELLLKSGLDADVQDAQGLSARSAARMQGQSAILELLERADQQQREAHAK